MQLFPAAALFRVRQGNSTDSDHTTSKQLEVRQEANMATKPTASKPRGPSLELGSDYLNQRSYQPGDLLACCGCEYGSTTDARRARCKCYCHETRLALLDRNAKLDLAT